MHFPIIDYSARIKMFTLNGFHLFFLIQKIDKFVNYLLVSIFKKNAISTERTIYFKTIVKL
jgi:hypothetical protein